MLPTLGLPELLDEAHGLALETTVEPAAGTGVDEVAEFLRAKVEEPAYRSEYRHHLYTFPIAFGESRGVGRRTGRGQRRGKRTCGTPSSP